MPRSVWFRWASPMIWNGQVRNAPKPAPEMTEEERETFWAAFAMCGMVNHG